MSIFAHREDTRGFTPRHPIVCIEDLVGASSAVAYIVYVRDWSLTILPAAILFQYVASGTYHWLPYNKVRQTIDHVAIALLIAGTYIQFWFKLLPTSEFMPLMYSMCSFALGICIFRIVSPDRLHGISYVMYLLLGLVGLLFTILNGYMFTDALSMFLFLTGVGLYAIQFAIFSLEDSDPWPNVFGYRELQHVILVAASDTHLLTAIVYLPF
jgi:hemolysin III